MDIINTTTAVTTYIDEHTAGTWFDNFACSCNNIWAVAAAIVVLCLIFWLIGYLTGGSAQREST